MNHRPRKRFGQNFLQDQHIIDRIISAFAPAPEDRVIEIGPGQAALTAPLLQHLQHLTVIELDRDLVAMLRQRFGERLHILSEDVLKCDFSTLCSQDAPCRIIGNLPYNITTPLLFHLLEFRQGIRDMLFMLQREVVERIAAAPGSTQYGRLSVMLQYHCHCEALFRVPAGAFKPPPAVESAIIRLTPAVPASEVTDYPCFQQLVSTAFGQRRKTLRNTLKGMLSQAQISACGIDPGLRAESLSVADFVQLANKASADAA